MRRARANIRPPLLPTMPGRCQTLSPDKVAMRGDRRSASHQTVPWGVPVSETSAIVAETAARIFEDLADPQTVNQAKDDRWQAPLWASLEESGLTLAWVPDTLGGAGASPAD